MRNKPFEADVAIPYTQKNNWNRTRHQILEEPRDILTGILTLAGETLSGWNSEGVPDHISGYKI